jgi:hypothetical protein
MAVTIRIDAHTSALGKRADGSLNSSKVRKSPPLCDFTNALKSVIISGGQEIRPQGDYHPHRAALQSPPCRARQELWPMLVLHQREDFKLVDLQQLTVIRREGQPGGSQ